jgi:hypothetical protein
MKSKTAQAQIMRSTLAGRVKGTTAQARAGAIGRGTAVRGQVAGKTLMARRKAVAAGKAGGARLSAAGTPVTRAVPGQLRRAAATGAAVARKRPVPLAVAGATLVVGYLALRWWRHR